MGWFERGRCYALPMDRFAPLPPTAAEELLQGLHVCRNFDLAPPAVVVYCWAYLGGA
jgi:hypothetical protein